MQTAPSGSTLEVRCGSMKPSAGHPPVRKGRFDLSADDRAGFFFRHDSRTWGPAVFVSVPCGTLQGEPISARIRASEILSPWLSCASPIFAARPDGRLRKPERCASHAFAASSTGRAWRGCPLGTKFSAEPRTRPLAPHTLREKFPCRCHSRPRMSAGCDGL